MVTWQGVLMAVRTVYGEASGEPLEGKLAVACVIINRMNAQQSKWGKTLEAVCLKHTTRGGRKIHQFSCWNDGPNRERILRTPITRMGDCGEAVIRALAVAGTAEDPSKGACHYHTHEVAPRWSRGREPDVIIGAHRFFVGID